MIDSELEDKIIELIMRASPEYLMSDEYLKPIDAARIIIHLCEEEIRNSRN